MGGRKFMWNEIQMEEYLRNNLKENRLKHSLGVRETAVKLAKKYGANIEKSRIAALVHDIAKEKKGEEILAICKVEGINIDNLSENSPSLLHGEAGAIIARDLMGVADEEILKAIKYHTTGRKNMSILEKVIYLADCIEPGRDFPGVEELRKLSESSLEAALLLSFDITIKSVISRGQLIHLDTIEARNYLIQNGR
jgi:predicted HD superfamily hydrolase involved in NAD metabolism